MVRADNPTGTGPAAVTKRCNRRGRGYQTVERAARGRDEPAAAKEKAGAATAWTPMGNDLNDALARRSSRLETGHSARARRSVSSDY